MTSATAPDLRVALREDVEISGPRHRGPRTVRIVHDGTTGLCYELGAKEAFLAERMQRPTDLATVGTAYEQAFGRPLTPAGWGRFLGLLHVRGLLAPTAGMPVQEMSGPADPPVARRSDLRTGRWVVAPVSDLVARLHRRVRVLLSPWTVLLSGLLVVLMLGWLVWTMAIDAGSLEPFTDWRFVVVVALLSWVSLSLHELGHGLAAQHHGGRATEVGVLFRPPMVYLYCRVEGGAYVTSRRSQVAVALAGVWVNLLLLLPLWAWWALDPDPGRRRVVVAGMAAGAVVGLVNLVPVPPADGYAALAAGLGQLDLSRDSRACVAATARALVGAEHPAYPRGLRTVYLGYAALQTALALAATAALLWYCLHVLPRAVGTATLAAALAFVLTVSVVRLAGTRTAYPSKGTS